MCAEKREKVGVIISWPKYWQQFQPNFLNNFKNSRIIELIKVMAQGYQLLNLCFKHNGHMKPVNFWFSSISLSYYYLFNTLSYCKLERFRINNCLEICTKRLIRVITVVAPNTAVLGTGEKQAVFRNSGIGREHNL